MRLPDTPYKQWSIIDKINYRLSVIVLTPVARLADYMELREIRARRRSRPINITTRPK